MIYKALHRKPKIDPTKSQGWTRMLRKG